MPVNRNEVRDADVQSLIRLAGEIGELASDLQARREHCLASLAKLCDAEKAVLAEFSQRQRVGSWRAIVPSVQFFNTPDHEQRRLSNFYDKNEPLDPVILHLETTGQAVMAGRPGDYLTDRVWRASAHYNEVRRPAGVVEQIYAHTRIGRVACGIGLHRRAARPFERREVRLVDIFLRGAGRSLHSIAAPGGTSLSTIPHVLPPRLSAVLTRFLLGETEKQAAANLGVTHHTIHSYAKQLYRRLGVSSRSELLARFIRRQNPLDSAGDDR